MAEWNRCKPIETAATRTGPRLVPSLSWPHLMALGVGAIVGTGILTLIGVGADRAGPAVLLSFAIAGAICACATLAYAEMATMMPAAGSAYTYSYAVLGETIAWVLVGPDAVLGCLYLFASLPAKTIEWCLLWNAIGWQSMSPMAATAACSAGRAPSSERDPDPDDRADARSGEPHRRCAGRRTARRLRPA